MIPGDHFSGHAAVYRAYRPHYPPALFAFLASQAPRHRLAWDCGTGNGQAAVAVAEHFEHVLATDISAQQIANADTHPRVHYALGSAEASPAAMHSVDLVTTAQALHWFDVPRFHAEVERVAAPGAILAEICYGLTSIDADVDQVVKQFYVDIVGPHWPPERRHVELGYSDLPFPFPRLAVPPFAITAEWNLDQLEGYLLSWSASQRYQTTTGHSPLVEIAPALGRAWGARGTKRTIRWPLSVIAGHASEMVGAA